MREARVRELMYDVDLRRGQKAETHARLLGVAIGMITIVACWFFPGYWDLRGTIYPGLPMFLEQWIAMALIGYGVSRVLEKQLVKKRFPYLNEQQEIVAG